MAAGINRVTLSLQDGAAPVLLDALRARTAPGCFRSYPAGNGRVEPVSNGRWNGLPQRESACSAFSGRCVVNLTAPGHRILWEAVRRRGFIFVRFHDAPAGASGKHWITGISR